MREIKAHRYNPQAPIKSSHLPKAPTISFDLLQLKTNVKHRNDRVVKINFLDIRHFSQGKRKG